MEKITQELIEKLSDKIGTTSQHVWELLCMQAKLDAIFGVVTFMIAAALLGAAWYAMYRFDPNNYDQTEFKDVGLIMLTVFSVTFVIAALCLWPYLATAWLNPEYYALRELFSAVSK
jgi:uncharacterized membrane-anchored protein